MSESLKISTEIEAKHGRGDVIVPQPLDPVPLSSRMSQSSGSVGATPSRCHPIFPLAPTNLAVQSEAEQRVTDQRRFMGKGGLLDRLALLVVVLLAVAESAVCIEDTCGACNAVAAELENGLSNEKPRNHLDMRHRLDSKGQREGKMIDYRVSELRIVELLDGLCEKVQDYTFEKTDSGNRAWIKVEDWDNYTLKIDKQEARAYSKDISSYCGRLLEETEDELAEMIKRGSVGPSDVGRVLCEDLSKHCGKSSKSESLEEQYDGEEL